MWTSTWTGPCYCSGRDLKSLVATLVSLALVAASIIKSGRSFVFLKASFVATRNQCRDINLSLCSFELESSYVTTSILCRDITLSFYRFELFVPDVATSISCRDIISCLCSFQLMVPDVATSISCRDFNLRNCNLQLSTSLVATSISCRDINLLSRHQPKSLEALTCCFWCRDLSPLSQPQLKLHQFPLFKPVIASRHFSCLDVHPLSRHQPLLRHHYVVATSFFKPLVNPNS